LKPHLQPEKTLLYSFAATYAEYVAASQRQEFFEIRAREVRILAEEQLYFAAYPNPTNWLVIADDDSPETLVVLPLLAHIAACAPRVTLRVVYEADAAQMLPALTDDPELLAAWDEADLPLLLSFDDEWHFQEQWGPHPQAIDRFWEQWSAQHGPEQDDAEQLAQDESPAGQRAYARWMEQLTQEMRLWYNSTLNQASAEELRALLARWHEESAEE
jgi:hypothetical protein